jgi:hypothetical protein
LVACGLAHARKHHHATNFQGETAICTLQILPFILLGIGLDDIFVLVRSVEEVNELHPNLPLPERFEKALNLGGMSITVTSVTNAAAFLFGSMTSIPAVSWCSPLPSLQKTL